MSLWDFHHSPIGGFLDGGNVEWYPDPVGLTEAGKLEYDLDYAPVGDAFFLVLGQVPIYTGFTVNKTAKKLIFDAQPDVGLQIDAHYNREV